MTSIDQEKRSLAQHMTVVRNLAHHQAGQKASQSICENFSFARNNGLTLHQGTIISGYWPILKELDVRILLEGLSSEGMQCVLPVVHKTTKTLMFRKWQPNDSLEKKSFGTFEPKANQPLLVPDVMLVPLLAVDKQGNRLGYGGGYFDRTIFSYRLKEFGSVTAVGMAFETQRIANVPFDDQDARLDWLVTEKGVYRFKV
ncbi:MAG: 5-formyltetrahydrofolate cyclo-ligase [Pseudomonadota bacterium]|nr:5-formyltetrahydrofolate cyclo-ligase [Pseudomonadota bacterium]